MSGDHTSRAHALLSCSGSSRWINCTPSARLEEKEAQGDSSDYAKEGTLAHELAELLLLKFTGEVNESEYAVKYKEIQSSKFYTKDMDGYVKVYVDYVLEAFAELKDDSKFLSIEDKLDLTEYIPGGFGTGDASIVSSHILDIFDLKYGRGVKVDATDNTQLMLYALGYFLLYGALYQFTSIRMNIVQPRMHNISVHTIEVEKLIQWANQIIKPAAKKANEGKGKQQAGSWCRWCKVKGKCATLAAKSISIAKAEFSNPPEGSNASRFSTIKLNDPHFLTDDQLSEIFGKLDVIDIWVKAVKAHLLKEAIAGKQWPGLKLVEGQSRRKWTDEEALKEVLYNNLYEEEDYTKQSLKGLGDIEKLIGKKDFYKVVGHLVIKPQGAPTLVPLSDKRPAMGIQQAKEDFKD